MNIEKRIEILEKKVAELEGRVQEQPDIEDIAKHLAKKIAITSKDII